MEEKQKKKASKAHIRATGKYEKKSYEKVLIRLPRGYRVIMSAAGIDSVNGYVVSLVKKDLGITNEKIIEALETELSEYKKKLLDAADSDRDQIEEEIRALESVISNKREKEDDS